MLFSLREFQHQTSSQAAFQLECILSSDDHEVLNHPALKFLKKIKFQKQFIPKTEGGEFENAFKFMHFQRVLYALDPSIALGFGLTTFMAALPVWIYGSKAQKATLADMILNGETVSVGFNELSAGNDVRSIKTQFTSDKGEYRIEGSKWISNNIRQSKAMILFLKNQSTGSYSLAFIELSELSSDSFEYLDRIATVGVRSCQIAGIKFNNTHMKISDLLWQEGKGVSMMLRAYQFTRTTLPGISLGGLEKIILNLIEFNSDTLLDHENYKSQRLLICIVKFMMCDCMANITCRIASLFPSVLSLLANVTKYYIPSMINAILSELSQTFSENFFSDHIQSRYLQKLLRDIPVLSVGHASSEVCFSSVISQLVQLKNAKSCTSESFQNNQFFKLFKFSEKIPEIDFDSQLNKVGLEDFILPSLKYLQNFIIFTEDNHNIQIFLKILSRLTSKHVMINRGLKSKKLSYTNLSNHTKNYAFNYAMVCSIGFLFHNMNSSLSQNFNRIITLFINIQHNDYLKISCKDALSIINLIYNAVNKKYSLSILELIRGEKSDEFN